MNVLDTIRKKSLTAKITATSSILTLMVVIVLCGVFVFHQKKQTYVSLEKRGIALARITAHNGRYGVMIGDQNTLMKLIRGIEDESDVAYVIIYDVNGNVLASTDTGVEQEATTGVVHKEAVNARELEVNRWNSEQLGTIYDIAAAINGRMVSQIAPELGIDELPMIPEPARGEGVNRKIGVVRIGMSTKSSDSAIAHAIGITALLATFLVVGVIFVTAKTIKAILNPLRELLGYVQVTGDGDLTTTITIAGTNDEVGELGLAFSQMQDSLRKMVQQMQKNAEFVDASASDLSSSSQQQAAGANEQSTSLTETSSAVQELATVSKQIAENAKKVSEIAEQTLKGMETIRENTTQGANRILALGDKSQSIGEVASMIDDITRQTNLLALNASIEAARAGTAGKGFAVVATEIRKLATNVAGSTDQIREIIKEIQDATNASVLATENITSSVESGIDISKMAAEAAAHINMATQQQKSASDQMVTTIKEMVSIAQQTSSGAKQIAETANKLSQTTKEQRELVALFKI